MQNFPVNWPSTYERPPSQHPFLTYHGDNGQRKGGKDWCSGVCPAFRVLPGLTKLTLHLVDDHPKGYPQLAAFIDSDENFLMCRRFGFLHSRVLLYRQDELSKLESNLIEMDQLDQEECPLALRSRKTDDARDDIEEQYSRKTLINQIDAKLKEYGNISPAIGEISMN